MKPAVRKAVKAVALTVKCTPKVRQCGIMSNKGVHFYA